MGSAVGSSLPYAFAIALSAAPILVMAVVLATTRPARVSGMFVLGWAAGIAVVAAIIVGVVDLSAPARQLSPHVTRAIRIILGVIVGLLALRSWRSEQVSPRWIASVARWSPRRALAIGFVLGSISPKNLALVGAGAAAILRASALPRDQAIAVVMFTAVASIGIAGPFVLQHFGTATTRDGLARTRTWLEARGAQLSTIILAVIAVVLLAQGLEG